LDVGDGDEVDSELETSPEDVVADDDEIPVTVEGGGEDGGAELDASDVGGVVED
jgi:hypothetical protein